MRCAGCGDAATVLKTVVCRTDRERRGVLCTSCWLPLRDRLWIIPGSVVVWGKCLSHGSWVSLRDLVDVKPGAAGKGVAPGGTCTMCAKEGA
jgi:hypothetical protein